MTHTINEYALFLNLLCHLCIFTGALYVVLHSTKLPKWHITPLWYAGLSCLLTAITILLGYAFGNEFPLSYANLGVVGETALNICLSIIALTFTVVTAKNRRRKR